MAPMKKSDITLIRYIYEPARRKEDIYKKFHKKPPLDFLDDANEWIEHVVRCETTNAMQGLQMTFTEWRIRTSNHAIFKVQDISCDEVFVIMGELNVYYMFYQKEPFHRRFSSVIKQFTNYCPCCVGYKHMRIMSHIMKVVATQNIY